MPEQRRRFSPQFKAEAVQMVIETGKPIAEVARDLGIHDGTLGNWVNAYRRAHPEPDAPLSPLERVRVTELEDEVRRLRLENEFLKKPRPEADGQSPALALRACICRTWVRSAWLGSVPSRSRTLYRVAVRAWTAAVK